MGVSKTELAVLALAIVALVTAAIFGDFAALTVILGSILAFFLAGSLWLGWVSRKWIFIVWLKLKFRKCPGNTQGILLIKKY